MKIEAQKAFKENGYKSYNDYLDNSVNDILIEYGIKTKFEKEELVLLD